MTITIDLTAEEEARLRAVAGHEGFEPVECLRRLLSTTLPSPAPGAATLALFADWEAEDATDDPAEIAARTREWEQLREDLNASRTATGEEPLFP